MPISVEGMKLHTATSWVAAALLMISLAANLEPTAAQPGFLSLDCGATTPRVDKNGISWVPDSSYIASGSTVTVAVDETLNEIITGDELKTLRYFNNTIRNRCCYVLPATPDQVYLIRAKFYYGRYDNIPSVVFGMAVDTFGSDNVYLSTTIPYVAKEYILKTPNDDIQLCLYRLPYEASNPMISSIELRPLDSGMYTKVQDGSLLLLQYRDNLGAPDYSIVRYPDDPYDREWIGWSASPADGRVNNITSTRVKDSGLAANKPPAKVMNTAMFRISAPSLFLHYGDLDGNDLFVVLYFAELQIANRSRLFDITINDKVWINGLNIYAAANNAAFVPIQVDSTTNSTSLSGNIINITFLVPPTSTLPSLCNSAELFVVLGAYSGRTLAADVVQIEKVKTAFGLQVWTGDPCLPKDLPFSWLNCSYPISEDARVSAIHLDSAGLSGPIPTSLGLLTNLSSLWLNDNELFGGIPDLSKLTNLKQIHLENNRLTGPIPEWLAQLPNLQELYLHNNNFSGQVPNALLNNSAIILQVTPGNPELCVDAECVASARPLASPSKGENKINVGIIVGVIVGAIVAVGVLVGLALMCIIPQIKKKLRGTHQVKYSVDQVKVATNNYAKILGRGGFGPVYYGKLRNGEEVAVKVLATGSRQGTQEFLNEVRLLTRIHHKNLVRLVGYCEEHHNMILLYEFMPYGTLQDNIYGNRIHGATNAPLNWAARLSIALNAAQGVEYLHTGCSPSIIHRDIKSNNILLTRGWVAKVSDFGLSRSTNSQDTVTHVSTDVKGTFGYLDPEYYYTNQLTDKSDVYSFGVVLLELVCGRSPFNSDLPEEESRIVEWVMLHQQAGNTEAIIDPKLKADSSSYCKESMLKVVDLAMSSVEPKSIDRPSMNVVCQQLREALELERLFQGPNLKVPPPPSEEHSYNFSESSCSGGKMNTASLIVDPR